MITTYVGIGSNIERHKHIEIGIRQLQQLGTDVRLSTIYECPSLGFESHSFLNLVVEMKTSFTLDIFFSRLKAIEKCCGRKADARKFQDRTLDLDIILFGEAVRSAHPQLPRKDIFQYPFVIQPLFELCPDLILPGDGCTIRHIWLQADNLNMLKPVEYWF
jgi:2-amino-4-hydroxy-6-hydroxymethyldihydropteridine diphosphokinase